MGCTCSQETTLVIYACSGAADVGEIADRTARHLAREGKGKMSCAVGVGGWRDVASKHGTLRRTNPGDRWLRRPMRRQGAFQCGCEGVLVIWNWGGRVSPKDSLPRTTQTSSKLCRRLAN